MIKTREKMRYKFISVILFFMCFSVVFVGIASASNISFIPPTPENNSPAKNITVNMSATGIGDAYSFLDLDRSLSIWFRLNNESGENSTFFRDWSTFASNATCVNCPVYSSSGAFGGAYMFNGVNTSINQTLTTNYNANYFTMSAWIYPKDISGTRQNVFGTTSASGAHPWMEIGCQPVGAKFCVVYPGSWIAVPSTNPLQANQWQHVVYVRNGTGSGNNHLYYNGVEQALTVDTSSAFTGGAMQINIGSRNGGGSQFFNGSIDEIMMFNRSLSAAEVLSLYNSTATQYSQFFNLTVANHTIRGYVSDSQGNVNNTEERTIVNTAFVLTNFSNYNRFWINRGKNLTMSVGCSTSASCNWGVDGINQSTGYNFNFTTGNYSLGVHNISVICNNSINETLNSTFSVEVLGADDFIIIHLPDQQYTNTLGYDYTARAFNWTSYLKNLSNIIFVADTGDVADSHLLTEYANANNSYSILDNNNVSYGVAPGNHDYSANFSVYFNYSRYLSKGYYGGQDGGWGEKIYYLLTNISGMNFIFIQTGYCPTDADQQWLYSVLNNYSNYRAVYFTHSFLNMYGELTNTTSPWACGTDAISGQFVWQNYIRNNSNLFMTLNGHFILQSPTVNGSRTTHLALTGLNNNSVMSVFTNYQEVDAGSGIVRYFVFKKDENKISSGQYNSVNNSFVNGTYDLEWEYSMGSPNITLSSPLNQTYTTNNLTINFSASSTNGILSYWFNNGTANITYTALTTALAPQGSNTFTFYVNDTFGSSNSTNVTFFVDSVAPRVTITAPTGTYVTATAPISITINETGNCIYSLNGGTTNRTLSTTNNLTFTGTTPSLSNDDYTLNAYCNDVVGNLNATVTSGFTIDVSSDSDSSSSGGGSTTLGTISLTDSQFKNGYTQGLNIFQRIKFSADNEVHYVGVISIGSDSAVINVSSDEQQATLSVGQSKEFEVTGDNYYDINVTLNSISGSTVNIKVMAVHDLIPEQQQSQNGSQRQDDLNESSDTSEDSISSNRYLLPILILILVIVLVAIVFLARKKHKETD